MAKEQTNGLVLHSRRMIVQCSKSKPRENRRQYRSIGLDHVLSFFVLFLSPEDYFRDNLIDQDHDHPIDIDDDRLRLHHHHQKSKTHRDFFYDLSCFQRDRRRSSTHHRKSSKDHRRTSSRKDESNRRKS